MTATRWLATLALLVGCAGPEAQPQTFGEPLPAGSPLLPARVRRLSNAELSRSFAALTGDATGPVGLVPDLRQQGFTRNAAQVVDPLQADAIHDHAQRLAAEIAARAPELGPTFLHDLAYVAFRRPPKTDELSRLQALFDSGGVELVTATVLEAPSTLYASELGGAEVRPGVVALTGHEIATELAYLISGGPPDQALLTAAAGDALNSADEREAQARRLLAQDETRLQLRGFVREWLGIDGLNAQAKSSELFPDFDERRPAMLAETDALIDQVMTDGGATVAALLDAGLLQQQSFLAAHSHDKTTSPVKRGVVVLERVLCRVVPRPGEVGIEVVPPPPDPTLSTRQLLQAHVSDSTCQSCHETIDGVGYAFENFDAVGAVRELDNGQPVDTSGQIALDDGDHTFADSWELTALLGQSEEVRRCYARQALRFASATGDPTIEVAFAASVTETSLIELLIAFVRNELFVLRRLP
ncbi:MAG TPA: DUF1588 domain-containing protein [Polyangiaceae bacterium]|nr:DUF1588 domain-containing protein [Polyangiaceae bacterium]